MKPEPEQDPKLHQLLQTWQITENVPPRFQQQVWHRLARRQARPETSVWSLLLDRFTGALARPSLAVSYLTALLVLGLATGYWQAHHQNEEAAASLGVRYVRLLDPYQTPR